MIMLLTQQYTHTQRHIHCHSHSVKQRHKVLQCDAKRSFDQQLEMKMKQQDSKCFSLPEGARCTDSNESRNLSPLLIIYK